jgi:hypothetical protein
VPGGGSEALGGALSLLGLRGFHLVRVARVPTGGRGCHSPPFHLDLRRYGQSPVLCPVCDELCSIYLLKVPHQPCDTLLTTQRIPQEVLTLSLKVDECKPLAGGVDGVAGASAGALAICVEAEAGA